MPRAMNRLAAAMTGLLALAVLALLARNLMAVPALVPLDPNEGWNAAHTLRLIAGGPLYPPPDSLMVNNYPPLSFYLSAALMPLAGDAIIAGRILGVLGFLLLCGGVFAAARRMGCAPGAATFAVLFLAGVLLIASDYVGIDDPQLPGHAVQMAGLLLLLRRRIVAAALLFALSLFLKHNLLALPLAAALWQLRLDRRLGLRFVAAGLAFGGAGLVLFRLYYGAGLPGMLASPRQSSLDNIVTAAAHLWWAMLPLLALARLPRNPWRGFTLSYAGIALGLGLAFSAGAGVDANAFFDLAIACAMALGLACARGGRLAAITAPLPLLAFLALNFSDNNFFFTPSFARQAARDIAFLRATPGPALCDQLSLCLWAGKGATVDVFNIGEAIKTGARDPRPLMRLIADRRFGALQLIDPDGLGPGVRAAIARQYRPDHSDDNGVFYVPR